MKLSNNESAYGTSRRAIAAYVRARRQLHRYPDGDQRELRAAIGEVYDLPAEQLVCGNGSDELIGLLMRCYVAPGDQVLLPQNHFVMCPIHARAQSAEVVLAEETGDHVDVDKLIAAVTAQTRMIVIANPNNPTGTYVGASELERLIDALPDEILVVLDGAYVEYVTADDFHAGERWAKCRRNVVMTRSFSKIHGLAGLRIGWALAAAEVIAAVNKIRTPFNTNAGALAAAAAAVRDQAFVERARRQNRQALDVLLPAIRQLGFRVTDSVANFYLIDFSTISGASTEGAAAFLEAHGIIPRPAAGGDRLRVTVGTAAENKAVLATLARYREQFQ